MNFLLDTNTVIYTNDRLAMVLLSGRYGVSAITEIELLSFLDLQLNEEQRIRAFLAVADRVALSEPIRDQAIMLRRLHRMKIPDAIIGATAMVGNAVLSSNESSKAFLMRIRSFSTPITKCSSAWQRFGESP